MNLGIPRDDGAGPSRAEKTGGWRRVRTLVFPPPAVPSDPEVPASRPCEERDPPPSRPRAVEERAPVHRPRNAFESADTVNRVVALLVRFPELHSIRSNPADATLTLTYAVSRRLDSAASRAFAEIVAEHVRAYHALGDGW